LQLRADEAGRTDKAVRAVRADKADELPRPLHEMLLLFNKESSQVGKTRP
jgi:hypothetical protein